MEINVTNKVRYSISATEPSYYPATVAECKDNLEIAASETAHDAKLLIMLKAATKAAEKYTGAFFAQRTVILYYDTLKTFYRLPVYPIRSIDSFEYLLDASYTAFTDFEQDLDDEPPLVRFVSFPSPDNSLKSLKFTLSVGYPSASSPVDADLIPDDIKQAIIFHVYQSFLTRGELSDAALTTFRNMLHHYRVIGI